MAAEAFPGDNFVVSLQNSENSTFSSERWRNHSGGTLVLCKAGMLSSPTPKEPIGREDLGLLLLAAFLSEARSLSEYSVTA